MFFCFNDCNNTATFYYFWLVNNELLSPFKNLELYLQKIDSELTNFYNSFTIEPFASRSTIDRENMQVSMYKDFYEKNENPIQIFTFSKESGHKIFNLLADGFSNINKALEFQRKLSKNKILHYLDTINQQVTGIFAEDLLERYSFLDKYKSIIIQNLEEYKNQENKQFRSIPILKLIPNIGENQTSKIEILYSLLTDNSLILCEKEEFFKAFTGQKVENGINWMAKSSKNNTTNKPLLVYFFRQLIDKKHIKSSSLNNENYYLTTIFRNSNGSKFTSQQLSSSKDSMSKNSSPQKELIDDIISQL